MSSGWHQLVGNPIGTPYLCCCPRIEIFFFNILMEIVSSASFLQLLLKIGFIEARFLQMYVFV